MIPSNHNEKIIYAGLRHGLLKSYGNDFLKMNINDQLRTLIKKGLTPEQAAGALGLDLDGANLSILSTTEKVITLDELIKEFKPIAARVLMDIALHGENENAKVRAASILLTGEGVLPELNASSLSERFAKMKRALKGVEDMESVAIEVETKVNV